MQTSVTKFLDLAQVDYTLKPHKNAVYTCEDAARERDIKVSQVVKCMVGCDHQQNLYVMLLPGDKILKLKRVRQVAGSVPINLVSPEELASQFNLIVGAISPFQFIDRAHFYIDNTVFENEMVSVSSGDPNAGILLKSEVLVELLKATKCNIISTSQ